MTAIRCDVESTGTRLLVRAASADPDAPRGLLLVDAMFGPLGQSAHPSRQGGLGHASRS